jgi:hypothetical protein
MQDTTVIWTWWSKVDTRKKQQIGPVPLNKLTVAHFFRISGSLQTWEAHHGFQRSPSVAAYSEADENSPHSHLEFLWRYIWISSNLTPVSPILSDTYCISCIQNTTENWSISVHLQSSTFHCQSHSKNQEPLYFCTRPMKFYSALYPQFHAGTLNMYYKELLTQFTTLLACETAL